MDFSSTFTWSVLVYTSASAKPITLESIPVEGSEVSLTMSDAGLLVVSYPGSPPQLFKPPYTGAGTAVLDPTGKSAVGAYIGKDGTLFGYNSSFQFFYNQGPSYSKPASASTACSILDINSKGEMCGDFNNGGGNDNQTAVWSTVTGPPIKFYNIGDPGYQPIEAFFIFDNGDIEVQDDYGNNVFAAPSATLSKRPLRLK
jgi:hypothetical protein